MAATERILRSARRQIEDHGILGLRVADVASGAFSSVTQIYRYFGNRDGLLARVLGDIYEELLMDSHRAVVQFLEAKPDLCLEDIIAILPSPTDERVVKNSEIRLQILAASVTNDQLAERLELISQQQFTQWHASIEAVLNRLPPSDRFDPRVFTIDIVMQKACYRKLLGNAGFTDEEYRAYMRDQLRVGSRSVPDGR